MKSLLGEGLEGFRERRSGRGWGRKISREQGREEPGGRRIEDDGACACACACALPILFDPLFWAVSLDDPSKSSSLHT